jgi:very-short-patch-repair endonuclease
MQKTEKGCWGLNQVSRFLKTKNETYAETLLRNSLVKRFSIKFERFIPVSSIVANFYNEKAKLIIELESKAQILPKELLCSEERVKELESTGFKVLRFSNYEIFHNLTNVLDTIERELEKRLEHTSGVPSKAYS